ncbi:SDR family oxidoreductase [Caballeronia sp. NK8]|uniref:SDR family oxidoreductase n=1 Tax=Caballeronia sp. NK8 TaxID=140098 RepID=UPI001BB5AAE0|nr:SDR family oxidoreductase [Caballeronia sp. NK8]BCQ26426.1 SDR family oxidoreductase [Caballeronia sp. NK8]
MNVKGSVVFVTGASRGLGLAFAREAVERGAAKVYAGMRNPGNFKEPGIIPIKLDVNDVDSIAAAAKAAPDVTLLVNNAGIAELTQEHFTEREVEQARRFFETNYYGMIRVTNAFHDSLVSSKGAIVNVLSDATWKVVPVLSPYSATKAAAWSYTNNIRELLRGQNVQVVGLHVGFLDTDLAKDVDLPKTDPRDVARQTYDVVDAGGSEVLADAGTRAIKGTLSAENSAYVDPSIV